MHVTNRTQETNKKHTLTQSSRQKCVFFLLSIHFIRTPKSFVFFCSIRISRIVRTIHIFVFICVSTGRWTLDKMRLGCTFSTFSQLHPCCLVSFTVSFLFFNFLFRLFSAICRQWRELSNFKSILIAEKLMAFYCYHPDCSLILWKIIETGKWHSHLIMMNFQIRYF